MNQDTKFLADTISQSELKLELSKLKGIAPKRKRKRISYSDVIWFLLDHYNKKT